VRELDPRFPKFSLPILGFAGYSGSGKTTLLVQILPLLKQRGLRVGLIKHSHHDFEIDYPGKDSYELRKAGADQVLISSKHRWALITETAGAKEPSLADLLVHLDPQALDLILVEGFKFEAIPKIEIHRPNLGKPLLFPNDPGFIAIAADAPLPISATIPVLDLNQPFEVADFIMNSVLDFPHDNRNPKTSHRGLRR
jgi:molybdopterin-guanine dinucleotide biosynthesis protein B